MADRGYQRVEQGDPRTLEAGSGDPRQISPCPSEAKEVSIDRRGITRNYRPDNQASRTALLEAQESPKQDSSFSAAKSRASTLLEEHTAMSHYRHQGHADSVCSVAVSGMVDFVVSGSLDGSMRIWEYSQDLMAYRLTAVLDSGHGGVSFTAVTVALFERCFLGGTAAGDIFLIGMDDNDDKMIVEVKRNLHRGAINAIAFMAHDAAGADGTIVRSASGGHQAKIRDEKILASASADSTVKIFAVCGVNPPYNFTLMQELQHNSEVLHPRDIDPDKVSASLASCARDGVYLWSLAGDLLMKLPHPSGAGVEFTGFTVTFEPSGDLIRSSVVGAPADGRGSADSASGPESEAGFGQRNRRGSIRTQSSLVGRRASCSGEEAIIKPAQETLLIAAGADTYCVWVLDDLAKAMAQGDALPVEAPPPEAVYEQADVDDVECSLDNRWYVLHRKDSFRCYTQRLELKKGETPYAAEGRASKWVDKHVQDILVEMVHEASVGCMHLTEDPEDGAVLTTGTADGGVYIWDLEGDDAGEMTAEMRSLSYLEILLPILLILVSFLQVVSFAFGPAVPWRTELRTPANYALSITMFEVNLVVDIDKADIFWPKITAVGFIMAHFILSALLNVPKKLTHATFAIRITKRFKEEQKNNSTCGPMHWLYAFAIASTDIICLLMQLEATILVVPLAKAVAEAVDCVPGSYDHAEQHSNTSCITTQHLEGCFLASAPSIHCYEGAHLGLLKVLLPVALVYFLILIPYAVVMGDVRYIQPGELLSVSQWRRNAERKATVLHLGPGHPNGDASFFTALTELLVKITLPSISVLTTSRPLLQMGLLSCIGAAWLAATVAKPPLAEPSFGQLLLGARVFTLCAMVSGFLTVLLGSKHPLPLALFCVSALVVPTVAWIAFLRSPKSSDNTNVQHCRTETVGKVREVSLESMVDRAQDSSPLSRATTRARQTSR